MTTVYSAINEYFASASSTAKKIVHDCEIIRHSYGDDWDDFSLEERDQELWTNLVHPDIEEKYTSYAQPENQQVFPKLKIECGEKIVVDFENEDGWTWRDEHSGPFSWRSRSQQDLTLFDDDDPVETVTTTRKTNSASSASPLIFTPKQSIWHSPFLRAQSSDICSDTAQVFTRFGIDVGSRDQTDETSSSEFVQARLEGNAFSDDCITTDGGYENHAADVTDSVDQPEPSLVDTARLRNGDDLGQVSPVFESDTSDTELANETIEAHPFSDSAEYDREMQSFHEYFTEACAELDGSGQRHSAITEQPQASKPPAIADYDANSSTTSDNISVTNMSVKSGYDFLDNW